MVSNHMVLVDVILIISVVCFVFRFKRETCLAHHIAGIAKHHCRNEQRNKHPTLWYIYSTAYGAGLYGLQIYTQNERCIAPIPLQ